jgi:hypothetical protein
VVLADMDAVKAGLVCRHGSLDHGPVALGSIFDASRHRVANLVARAHQAHSHVRRPFVRDGFHQISKHGLV